MPEPSEIEAQVRQHAAWLAEQFTPLDPTTLRERVDGGEHGGLIDAGAEPSEARRPPIWLIAAAAIVAVVGMIGALVVSSHIDGDQGLQVVDAPSSGTWESVPDLSVGASESGAELNPVWTGSEILLVGAMDSSNDLGPIAAFSPTGKFLGVGDVRGPAWMTPHASAWEQPATPTPYEAIGLPGAQVWMADRFLAWGGPGYGTPVAQSQLPGALSVDLPNGDWSRFPGPPGGEPTFTEGILAGDRIFTWGIDNDFRHVKGHGTIRAAISSAGFGITSPGAPETAPTTDDASGAFCADFHAFLETYQTQVAADGSPATTDPQSTDRLVQQMLDDMDDLVRASPPEIRAAMEHAAQQAHAEFPDMQSGPEDQAQAAVIDEWLHDHCGFTTGNPNPLPDDTSNRGGSGTTGVPNGPTAPSAGPGR